MTLKDALDYLENRISKLSINLKIGNRDIANLEIKYIVMGIETHVMPIFEKALTELEELKKRDTAMKPKMVDYTTQHFLCPSCNETISVDESETFNKIFNAFFKYCGQRLDWEETK